MVRVFHLGLVAAVLSALSLARPLQPDRLEAHELMVAPELAVRSERSANLSHITGPARKIQMYIKNRHLQILPDGTVNGTSDDVSDYSKFLIETSIMNTAKLPIQVQLCADIARRST
ncbi:uncharacterized protein LOC126470190 [Schistocerca serialis cubense]|uniref:uncharacterized protein LOC126470190 n=1 Tax=Schistocerca serialis cubense TaxID=2023355 RepID=UPI00214EF187|nr:uncharacterized protein LOC126470190 [Schistocerca serialis cubense]